MGASKVVNFLAKTKLQVWNAFLSPFSPPKGPVIIYHLGGLEDFFGRLGWGISWFLGEQKGDHS